MFSVAHNKMVLGVVQLADFRWHTLMHAQGFQFVSQHIFCVCMCGQPANQNVSFLKNSFNLWRLFVVLMF
jgi:hypothetical protein